MGNMKNNENNKRENVLVKEVEMEKIRCCGDCS